MESRVGKPSLDLDDPGLDSVASVRDSVRDDDMLQRSQTEERQPASGTKTYASPYAIPRQRVASASAAAGAPPAPPSPSAAAGPASAAVIQRKQALDRAFVSTTMAWGKSKSQAGNKWSSTAGFKDSLTGREVSRAQAMAEVGKVQKESAIRILNSLEAFIPSLESAESSARMVLLGKLDDELERSRQMLLQHSRDLLGSDLAELRIQKTERKALLDRIDRINRQNTHDILVLQKQLWDLPDRSTAMIQSAVLDAQDSASLTDFGRDGQTCMLTAMEQKLATVLASTASKDTKEVPKQPSRLETAFVQERVAALKHQVTTLTEQISAANRQISVLVAMKEELTEQLNNHRGVD